MPLVIPINHHLLYINLCLLLALVRVYISKPSDADEASCISLTTEKLMQNTLKEDTERSSSDALTAVIKSLLSTTPCLEGRSLKTKFATSKALVVLFGIISSEASSFNALPPCMLFLQRNMTNIRNSVKKVCKLFQKGVRSHIMRKIDQGILMSSEYFNNAKTSHHFLKVRKLSDNR